MNDLSAFRKQNGWPEPEQLLDYSPSEAGQFLLGFLLQQKQGFAAGDEVHSISDRGYGRHSGVERVLLEGLAFLERQGLVVSEFRRYSGTTLGRILSREGEDVAKSATRLSDFLARISDPRDLLHPEIRASALSLYERGQKYFEAAVFQAFKTVEVAVREAAGLTHDHLGVKMMRRVFGPGGELRDGNAEPGEEDGVRDLFAGAIAVYKNPPSHRNVEWTDSVSVLRALFLASELMHIVEVRAQPLDPSS
jgi:uncharacterized protein (TIGR02391 family)